MAEEKRMMDKQRKRDNTVNSLLRLQSFARRYIPEQADEVPSRLEYLEKCWDTFQVIQDEYEEMDSTQELLQNNQDIREAMEELYLQTKSILIAAVRPTTSVVVKQELPSSSTASVKLPTISLPNFDGDYGAWLTFHDTFESLVHNSTELSDVQKFHYLRAALEGEAAGLIKVLTISAENYTIAWNTLVERYSNKVLLRKKHVRSLLSLPKCSKGSVQAIRSTVDQFKLNLQVLQQLGEPIDDDSTIILELLADKLDDASVTAWEESLSPREQPTYGRMIEFLHRRIHTLESIQLNRPTPTTSERKLYRDRVSMNAASSREQTCVLCEDQHALHQCTTFMNHSQEERVKVIREKRLCANCLRGDHTAAKCTNKFSCRQCSGRHHTLIHPALFSATERHSEPAVSTSMLAAATIPSKLSNTTSYRRPNAFLSTVALTIVDARGGEHVARALLDSGSQLNAISERLCQQLRLRRNVVDLAITGVDSTTTSARHQVSAEIRSRDMKYVATLDFIVLRKVTHDIPADPISTADWKLPPSATLADPHFNTVGRIDMIIGAAYFYTFLKEGRIRLFDQGPLLVETVFGWVVTGNPPHIAPKQQSVLRCHFATVNDSLQGKIEQFWKLEEIVVVQPSVEEQECEKFFSETVSRNSSGRYIVRLPKHRNHDTMIGISKPAALRRFKLLERKLSRNDDLRKQYHDFMKEYVELGHMTPVEDDNKDGPEACYLPHHPVFKDSSSTTKMRVVFDGSAATSTGHSLNDSLTIGPVVQDDLVTLIMRFRKFKVAVVADLEKMYRQVLVHPDDRPLQRIVWRFDSDQPLQVYELDTVTYGLTPSSFLATRTLLQLVKDEGNTYPLAASSMKENMYMDDLLTGSDSVEGAILLRKELATLVNKGGFMFRKWCSNSLCILEDLPTELLGTKSAVHFDKDESIKTLGVRWEPEADVFRLDVSVIIKPSPHTKRSVLSSIAQLYDPLGLISPVIVQAKMMMQSLWLLGIDWDEEIPIDLQRKWNSFCEQLPRLQNFYVERFVFISGSHQAELHCFTDASETGYGACLYIRSETSDGAVQVRLLTSKSKVAPLKPVTIPRLELCAALLGARLFRKVKEALDSSFSAQFFWSDSTVVLQWLQAPARTWKTFVANRVAEIQDTTQGSRWQHVSGKDNPADLISRGCTVDELTTDQRWKYGPSWLQTPKAMWPSKTVTADTPIHEELKHSVTTLAVRVEKPNEIFELFSTYSMLLRAVAYCYRFYNNMRKQSRRITSKMLLVSELKMARIALVKIVQLEVFGEDLQRLKKRQPIHQRSSLRLLNPFVDADGVIRVGGRLQQSDASYEVRHPAIIPGFHPFTYLLLQHQHLKLLHGGVSHTLSVVREEYWPLNGRRAVRSAIRKCYNCCRANPRPIDQPEGQLPVDRVTANDAFICTGVDYCGPIFLKPIHRKAASRKAYICIFVCLSTKAVHLELVSELSTSAFLMALDRFIYRKGKPAHIYSDNGTNFIGAKNALHAVYAMLNHEKSSNKINKHLADETIQWHLIPPRAPNFGGLWEAAVKVAKTHLVRQLGNTLISEEEMATVLVKIEGCMNSRPLTPLSSDPNDLEALTPAHFLIRRPLHPLPEFDAVSASRNQLAKYQRIQKTSQQFWDRWCNEYRKELNIQHRGHRNPYRLTIGDLIILKDDQLPPTRWPLARVLELHPGPDGILRVATVQTRSGIVKRAVNKLCRLECV